MNSNVLRLLIVIGIVVPLAIYVGYLLSNPYDLRGMGMVFMVAIAIASPLLLKSHHVLPFLFWNASMNFYFLPGQPPFWVLCSVLSVAMVAITGALERRNRIMVVPSIGWPLIAMLGVVLFTARMTGGFGGEVLGNSQFGGKSYMLILGAIVGFFALSTHEIPIDSVRNYLRIFFLSSLTGALSDLILFLGPSFYFLYAVISSSVAETAWAGENGSMGVLRFQGLAVAGQGCAWYMLARYGIRGLTDLRRWWRPLLFVAVAVVSFLGGYRSNVISLALLIACQFFFEKMFRTAVLPIAALAAVLLLAVSLPFIKQMPLAIQRSLSFLPVEIDTEAALDAQGTSEWRLEMWKAVLPEVPHYLFVGKGAAINGMDLYLTDEAQKRGLASGYDPAIISGSYHNGPLTTIIPFGIWGAGAFLWFCYASIRYLHQKKEHGHPALRTINAFLLSSFISRLVFFLTIYGQLNLDMASFVGIIGFGVALNRGAENPRLNPVPRKVIDSVPVSLNARELAGADVAHV